MSLTIESHLGYLIQGRGKTSSFFPYVIRSLERRMTPGLGTAGVTIDRHGRLILLYDPELANKLTVQQFTLVMIHEVYHLVLNHIPRALRLLDRVRDQGPLERRKFVTVSNIAMDYAVNSLMVQTAECIPSDFKRMGNKDPETGKYDFAGCYPTDAGLPERMSYEWYFNNLLADLDGYVKELAAFMIREGSLAPGDGPSDTPTEEDVARILDAYRQHHAPTADDRELEKAAEGMTSDQIAGSATNAERETLSSVRKAQEQAKKDRGTLPGCLSDLINDALREAAVPWEQYLKQWLSNTLRSTRVRSMKRPKRRASLGLQGGCNFPGRKSRRVYTLIFAIDTSGSMSNDDIASVLTELRHIQGVSKGIKVRVIECDARIGREYELTDYTPVRYEVTGRGGTEFEPVFLRAQELRADAILYGTDGYGSLPGLALLKQKPLCWIITKGGVPPWEAGYGSGIQYGRCIRL